MVSIFLFELQNSLQVKYYVQSSTLRHPNAQSGLKYENM